MSGERLYPQALPPLNVLLTINIVNSIKVLYHKSIVFNKIVKKFYIFFGNDDYFEQYITMVLLLL